MDQEIVDYVLRAQKHGLAEQEIKQNLLNAGWDAGIVEQSFIYARAADTHFSAGEAASPRQIMPAFKSRIWIGNRRFFKIPGLQ